MKLSPNAHPHALAMPSPSPPVAPNAPRRVAPAASSAPPISAPATGATGAVAVTKKAKTSAKPGEKGDGKGGAGAPKKRVRLKPETPEQLIERLRNPQLSLHEASILLRVSRATVRRYADSGRLGCQRTPGGQRRFYLRDIENFYRQLKLKR